MPRPALLATLALLIAACARDAPARLDTYKDTTHGFSIVHPSSWHRAASDEGRRVWFLPAPLPAGETPEDRATEFIVVMTQAETGPLPEPEVRRLAMSLLPMHGVSGFQRTPAGTETVIWYRFELTGSTGGDEWASLGTLVTGPRRFHYAVCAGPLPTWRDRQKLCDQVLKSFTPGDLEK